MIQRLNSLRPVTKRNGGAAVQDAGARIKRHLLISYINLCDSLEWTAKSLSVPDIPSTIAYDGERMRREKSYSECEIGGAGWLTIGEYV
jgi:hypothetical protein